MSKLYLHVQVSKISRITDDTPTGDWHKFLQGWLMRQCHSGSGNTSTDSVTTSVPLSPTVSEGDSTSTNQEKNPVQTSSSSKDSRPGAGAIISTVFPSRTESPVLAPSNSGHPLIQVPSDSASVNSTQIILNTVTSSLQAHATAVTPSQSATSGDQVAGQGSVSSSKVIIPICAIAFMVLLGAVLYWRRKRRLKRFTKVGWSVKTKLQPFSLEASADPGAVEPRGRRTKPANRDVDESLLLSPLTPPLLINPDISSRPSSRNSTSSPSSRTSPRLFAKIDRSDTPISAEISSKMTSQPREGGEVAGEVPHLVCQMRALMQRFEALETAVQGGMTPGVVPTRQSLLDGIDLEDRPPDYVPRPMSGEGQG
ncbi:hypothetical protein NP233_g4242 [Leucocoprinus birnbaumii]|uniref:Uncharacterized protein n=1 Tax=Leucocoprinus birnbaumii TaxID=56174 RepID=A0AAD5VWG1_9AGAR|nr:hypothetical protein NP233_g4242 [Leucocoprinus birnbaumii]